MSLVHSAEQADKNEQKFKKRNCFSKLIWAAEGLNECKEGWIYVTGGEEGSLL